MPPTTTRIRALVTNSDGVDSTGLVALADAAAQCGLDVQVVAPCWDSSGAGAALTAVSEDSRIVAERCTIGPYPGRDALAVHGAPAFIVRAAVYGAFRSPPDVVLSGVNRGSNVGRAVLHSGTVGAALTGAAYGRRALAISADVGEPVGWETATTYAGRAVDWLLRAPPGALLNVNVPRRSLGDLRGVMATRLASVGAVQANVTERDGDFVAVTFADESGSTEAGTDAAAVADGYVSVTPLRPLCEDDSLDLAALLR